MSACTPVKSVEEAAVQLKSVPSEVNTVPAPPLAKTVVAALELP